MVHVKCCKLLCCNSTAAGIPEVKRVYVYKLTSKWGPNEGREQFVQATCSRTRSTWFGILGWPSPSNTRESAVQPKSVCV